MDKKISKKLVLYPQRVGGFQHVVPNTLPRDFPPYYQQDYIFAMDEDLELENQNENISKLKHSFVPAPWVLKC